MELSTLFGCKESYELPNKILMAMLDDTKRVEVLSKLKEMHPDMAHDFLRDDFQQEHGDRDKFKQDYTPDCICKIVAGLLPKSEDIADICAGTGALSIASWAKNPHIRICCEEMSTRAIPFLLMNLAIRNMDGQVIQGDALTGKTECVYRLTPAEHFSKIEKSNGMSQMTHTRTIIMNPPYSLKWKPIAHEQYQAFGPMPTNAADFAFVCHGLYHLADGGTLIAVLPHGVLFRGNKEAAIRQKLIEKKSD